ncbi:hypothetical protein [Collinsella intestinalis]|uniref:hypothetical protein n=1 Tax=Collinsella intestinalis TaxID=147207 RepID=UPI00195E193B|nr:hypothetical protein [Collinsella intestinalis]MBM6941556.1 hypothetical protein [Collinsella intestinalis]
MEDMQEHLSALDAGSARAEQIARAVAYAAGVVDEARNLLYGFDDPYADAALAEAADALAALFAVRGTRLAAYRAHAAGLASRMQA